MLRNVIEVFKTNVTEHEHANKLVAYIHAIFKDHEANFDLHDCDRILRIKCSSYLNVPLLVAFLKGHGCEAEVLPG